MGLKTVTQLDVFLKNTSGQLMKVTKWLYKKKIQILAHTIGVQGDFGTLKIIVREPEKALKYLKKKNIMVTPKKVFCVKFKSEPGGLHRLASTLGAENIDIKYIYGFILLNNESMQVIEVDDQNMEKTAEIFEKEGIRLYEPESIYKLDPSCDS